MIPCPVVPRVPLALQASSGVTIDPASGVVTISPTAMSAATANAILNVATAALPTVDPRTPGLWWNNRGVPSISQG